MSSKPTADIEHLQCVWGLLCSISSIDQERNNISLFNVIEQFNITSAFFDEQAKEKKPLLFTLPYEVILHWRRRLDVGISDEEIRAECAIKTIDPSGTAVQEMHIPLHFPKGMRRLRSRFLMQGIPVTTPGDYEHQIDIKLPNHEAFKKVLEIPFEVRRV